MLLYIFLFAFYAYLIFGWIFQNNFIHLLEIALSDETDKTGDMLQLRSASALVDMLPVIDVHCGNFADDHIKCHLEGIMFLISIQLIVSHCFSSNLTKFIYVCARRLQILKGRKIVGLASEDFSF